MDNPNSHPFFAQSGTAVRNRSTYAVYKTENSSAVTTDGRATYLKVLAGDATREEVEQLVLDIRNLIWSHQQLQHFLQLVQEDDLLARASPWPVPNEALIVEIIIKKKTQHDDGKEGKRETKKKSLEKVSTMYVYNRWMYGK